MKLKCGVGEWTGIPACEEDAVIVILSVHDDSPDLVAYPVCLIHAGEEVHEARSSMQEDEFVIVNLTAETRLEQVRRYALVMTDSVSCPMRDVANDVLDIINGQPVQDLSSVVESPRKHPGDDGCGHRDAAALASDVGGDEANHEPGGKYHAGGDVMRNLCLPCGGREFDTAEELITHVQVDHGDPKPIIWEGEWPT